MISPSRASFDYSNRASSGCATFEGLEDIEDKIKVQEKWRNLFLLSTYSSLFCIKVFS